jgi:uncharacterized protein with HEPN domain
MSLEAFREDANTVAAVERKLLVISEAAVRLGDQAALLCPAPPWPKIHGMGNWIRHSYDRVDIETIWFTITDDLPPFKAALVDALISFSASSENW